MKKIICFILSAMLLFTVIPFAAFAANGPTVSITASGNACPGNTVVLTVAVSNNTGFKGFNINVKVPAGFTVKSVSAGPVIAATAAVNPTEALVTFASANPITDANIVLFTVELVAGNNVGSGTQVEFDSVSMSDANKLPIATNVVPGFIMGHTAGTPVQENINLTDCAAGGTYDEVVYCSACGGEISRTLKTIAPAECVDANFDGICDNCSKPLAASCAHPKTATRTMVVTPATCKDNGTAFTMVYCTVCGQTISTFPMTLPATNAHVDENEDGKCDVCGDPMSEHVHELVHTDAKAATCTEDGNVEYWYCEGCDSYFTDAEGKNKVDATDVVVPAAHKVEKVEAKAATETEDGNIEYWRCTECGCIWLDAECTTAAKLEDVVIPATGHVHDLVYTAAKEATCFEEGNLEYWYCAGCDCYFTDAEGKYNIAYLSLILPVSHKIVHVEAKAPTCFEEGNIEYWYCTECGYAWLDELCTKNTNLMAVVLPVSHKIVHVEAKAPTETENGNIEYWYCTECGYAWLDELCTKNTNLKAVILPATGAEINPPTGDVTILYIAAVAVIATLGVAVIRFKKREEN